MNDQEAYLRCQLLTSLIFRLPSLNQLLLDGLQGILSCLLTAHLQADQPQSRYTCLHKASIIIVRRGVYQPVQILCRAVGLTSTESPLVHDCILAGQQQATGGEVQLLLV